MKSLMKSACFVSLLIVAITLSSCYAAHSGSSGGLSSGGGSSSGFTIGGTVTGLAGTGLVLLDNGGDNLSVSASGAFQFKTLVSSGGAYTVSVLTQPSSPAQTCVVTGGTGTAAANVSTVQVTCTTGSIGNGNIIGGQVTGLLGSGLVLQDNGTDSLPVRSSGPFNFATTISNGAAYNVTVLVQPSSPTQTCTVAGGSGTASSNVGNVVVTCSSGTLAIGGSVSGLSGAGLVLADTNGDNVSISANGAFQFPILLVSGTAYNVTIKTQPTAPSQTCTISNNTGTATTNVTAISVICPAVFHSIGGQVVGLYVPTGQQSNMVIQNNGGDNLPITQNGAFTFVSPVAHGSAYDITIFVQPSSQPGINCITWGWNGTALSNVTDVTIDCGHNDWTWMAGPDTSNKDAQATTPPPALPHTQRDTDTPGGSKYSSTWTDSVGNLWLLTGSSHTVGASNVTAFFGEMWEFQGTQDYDGGWDSYWSKIAISAPTPTPRWGATTWVDGGGNFWLFGGQDIADNFLNDLWTFNPSTKTWTQVSLGTFGNGVYGSKGTPNAANLPGARWGATLQRNSNNGDVWLFGGFGFDGSSANPGVLNDLWKFSGGQWTWVSGSNTANPAGVYGTLGAPSGTTVPGGRQAAASWLDTSGNFWVFGGFAAATGGQLNAFNDLWEFSGGQWTWVNGANVLNQVGNYGLEGVAAATNVPGARYSPAAWTDASGNFWMFGGFGYDATGNGTLADLWEFKGGQWIWTKGPSSVSQIGVYGIQPNTVVWPHVIDYPGSRWGASYWVAPNGFWMFGGEGFDSQNGGGDQLLSDLWRYLPFP